MSDSKNEVVLIGSIDQGTQSSRFIVYDPRDLSVAKAHHATPLRQSYPRPGWVEQDPEEIWSSVVSSVEGGMHSLRSPEGPTDAYSVEDPPRMVIGIANQRETTILWDKETGKPLHNAIVWNDDRTAELCARLAEELGGVDVFRRTTGLPISTYFSAYKIRWMIENVPAVAEAVASKRCMFGTVDCWLVCVLGKSRAY